MIQDHDIEPVAGRHASQVIKEFGEGFARSRRGIELDGHVDVAFSASPVMRVRPEQVRKFDLREGGEYTRQPGSEIGIIHATQANTVRSDERHAPSPRPHLRGSFVIEMPGVQFVWGSRSAVAADVHTWRQPCVIPAAYIP